MTKKLLTEIKQIPGDDGFWNKSTEVTFKKTAQKLLDKGFGHDEVIEMLSNLYSAVASEFGN